MEGSHAAARKRVPCAAAALFLMFGGRRAFADQFRCHSVSLLAAEQQRDPARLEYADKIILPPSCLERLAHLEITYPMIFELTNPRYLQRRLHCTRDANA